jgi:hypothetical protein
MSDQHSLESDQHSSTSDQHSRMSDRDLHAEPAAGFLRKFIRTVKRDLCEEEGELNQHLTVRTVCEEYGNKE